MTEATPFPEQGIPDAEGAPPAIDDAAELWGGIEDDSPPGAEPGETGDADEPGGRRPGDVNADPAGPM